MKPTAVCRSAFAVSSSQSSDLIGLLKVRFGETDRTFSIEAKMFERIAGSLYGRQATISHCRARNC